MDGRVIMLMGLPASGKSTVAKELFNILEKKKKKCILVDADDLADFNIMPNSGNYSLNARLSRAKMLKNLVNWLEPQFDYILVAASGQPRKARDIFKTNFLKFTSVYLNTEISQCRKRDYKGIYKLKNVVGVDLPFDEPLENDVIIDTKNMTPSSISLQILKQI